MGVTQIDKATAGDLLRHKFARRFKKLLTNCPKTKKSHRWRITTWEGSVDHEPIRYFGSYAPVAHVVRGRTETFKAVCHCGASVLLKLDTSR